MNRKHPCCAEGSVRKGRPVQMEAGERRDLILDAVETFMVECGLARTSMDAVAKRAGMSKRTVYEVFDSRETLFSECLVRRSQLMLEPLTPAQKALSLAERLDGLFTFNLSRTSARQSVEMLRSVISSAREYPSLGRQIHLVCMGRLYDMVENELVVEIRRGALALKVPDARIHAVLLTDMALESPLRLLLDPDATLEDTQDKAARRKLAISIFLKGVGARPHE
ncbi:TetR/AcrR family transcriptional regulator [Pseudohoeflea suaedae]|uniref:TetR/AcrR family transcriptional regulator n=1 Tax=Pseudohoeflea suaedae TaxID=877384 RepID=A0A4R5PJV7_9HYPH|nr:TetR/AcrR family transcriptional regulator [Pseudohoeflea suaedae]TDH35100.1 TetR/AcrR family transcriptional regulator [Pseudohoeflea suaedae]